MQRYKNYTFCKVSIITEIFFSHEMCSAFRPYIPSYPNVIEDDIDPLFGKKPTFKI